jgi:DnaJ family protein C protein 25
LVNNMHDFGAGFHKPTYRDLIVVKMAKWPYHITTGMLWQAKYLIRRWKGSELSEEERNVLTERAVGHVTWELATEEDQVAIVKRELWVKENLVAWKEQQEIKNLSRAEQKHIAKMKKKGIKDE